MEAPDRDVTPSSSSMMSLPTLASVVHLQLLIALAAQRLCALNLHTSQLSPCDVTPDRRAAVTRAKPGRVESEMDGASPDRASLHTLQ